MARSLIPAIFALLMAAACTRQRAHSEPQSVSIPYTLSNSSESFAKYMVLSIDSMHGALVIFLQCRFPNNAAFPVNQAYKDTLTETAFTIELKADGQSIPYDADMYGLYKAPLLSSMSFISDTIDLRTGTSTVSIPYYAFHRLKSGTHELGLSISQHTFRSNHTIEVPFYDSVFRHPSTKQIYNHAEKQMVFAKAYFMLYVPHIHQTMLYMNRIDLRNDSAYSPYGSDNTLWNSSLPDLYWEVLYPQNNRYATSAYETSTMQYTTPDTFSLYHYSTMDTIGFEVMDHDMLSHDDGMGYAYYSLRDIIRRKRLNTAFGNVKLFSIRADYKGIINP